MPFEDFKIDPITGDITLLETGYFETISGNERVAQACKIRLQSHVGEWILDISSGLDWMNEILVKNPDFVLIRARVVEQLRQVPDVLSVESVEVLPDFETRTLVINFVARSTFGPVEGSV